MLSFIAGPMGGGLLPVIVAIAVATILETFFFQDYPWKGLLIHIFGCVFFFVVMLLLDLLLQPSEPLAPWMEACEPNFPFQDFHYVADHGHGEFSYETDPAYLWWVIIAIPVIRGIIIQPLILCKNHLMER